MQVGHDTLNTQRTLTVNEQTYHYYSLDAAKQAGMKHIQSLPRSLKVLLENLLRFEEGKTVTIESVQAMNDWVNQRHSSQEIAYRPARVLMQDFTGVPAIVDLAAMRSAMHALSGDPKKINPLSPVDLVIDHSVQVDHFATQDAFAGNVEMEMQRNRERYELLRWGQKAFTNFRVVPPGTGICHQVNLEYLAKAVWQHSINGKTYAYPDTLVGTDSHTTMINGLGVLGWGVGGIEAEAAMLGQPISMLIPDVIGFKLTGKPREGITATDLVLMVTQQLRQKGVVGKFVEFYGPGLRELTLADRATVANMAPEYGATCGFFPIDKETLTYMRLTGRDEQTLALVEAYCKAQGLWLDETSPDLVYTDTLELDLSSVEPSVAGPKRPQDRVSLSALPETMDTTFTAFGKSETRTQGFATSAGYELHHGDVVIAAVTSCTNTSNPHVLIGAGLLARKAIAKGLSCKPWVKTSLAPGSKVVTDYLTKTNLMKDLEALGFHLVGYGCTTCIGNSGPLPEPVANTIDKNDLLACAVLSGNRNFEGRIHPQVKANWLASPPLVVAFALAGTTCIDLTRDSLGNDPQGKPVYLKDIWPSNAEIAKLVAEINRDMFHKEYAQIFNGDQEWQSMQVSDQLTYDWQSSSTYVQHPPFFQQLSKETTKIESVKQARIIALLGDSITTDHISPAGAIKKESPAGDYLLENGVRPESFNSYGSRRGNHEVMMRGTFANIRIRNEMASGTEGGYTRYIPSGEIMTIYDAAMRYQKDQIPLVVIAGKEYGTGSSRDWAAKGTLLLGIKAVIAESFERIHRSNLIGMGVLPLQFKDGVNRKTLQLDGSETIDLLDLEENTEPNGEVRALITDQHGKQTPITLLSRIDTYNEQTYYQQGGILSYVLRNLA